MKQYYELLAKYDALLSMCVSKGVKMIDLLFAAFMGAVVGALIIAIKSRRSVNDYDTLSEKYQVLLEKYDRISMNYKPRR